MEHLDVQISVTDFGPIGQGRVDLRPLTVFVGPSNAGKTYLAVLIYALHRTWDGFPKLPILRDWIFSHQLFPDWKSESETRKNREELRAFLQKLSADAGSTRYSDLPSGLREDIEQPFDESREAENRTLVELKRCFGIESIAELVRLSTLIDESKVSLTVREGGRKIWGLDLPISGNGARAEVWIDKNMDLVPGKQSDLAGKRLDIISGVQNWMQRRSNERFYDIDYSIGNIINQSYARGTLYYLPAARSGIMQSHRVIASSLVGRAAYAGVENFPVTPLFPGVTADFIRLLINYEEKSSEDQQMRDLAKTIETGTLAGQVLAGKLPTGSYPYFKYKPKSLEVGIGLSRSSSMVSELAPLVLFLRGYVKRGDTIIIEEPEAHLHPAAQAALVGVLARIVRAGVRLIITTHSDWLLKGLGNLIREGELLGAPRQPRRERTHSAWLLPAEVGVWLFRERDSSKGSLVEELEFNRTDGVEPDEYYDVEEELYNRSADLQNGLAKLALDGNNE